MPTPSTVGSFSAEGQGWLGRILWMDSELSFYFCLMLRKDFKWAQVALIQKCYSPNINACQGKEIYGDCLGTYTIFFTTNCFHCLK